MSVTASAIANPFKMMKILYNDCYGGFSFSKEFEIEYKLRTGKAVDDLYRFGGVGLDMRTDPVSIAIFEEKGSRWCSGMCSEIAIYEIPAAFEDYWSVDEYDGNETVIVNTSQAFADILEKYIKDGDHGAMIDAYQRIKSAQRNFVLRRGIGLAYDDGKVDYGSGSASAAPETASKSAVSEDA